jgi:hypothetical protein
MGEWVIKIMPWPLYPMKDTHSTHCTGGRVGPRAIVNGYGKSRTYRDLIPGLSTPLWVTIPTMPSQPPPSNLYYDKPIFTPSFYFAARKICFGCIASHPHKQLMSHNQHSAATVSTLLPPELSYLLTLPIYKQLSVVLVPLSFKSLSQTSLWICQQFLEWTSLWGS